jgi:putative holliday junction resolvase
MPVFLCLDLGEKRIGVAVGSSETRLAKSLELFDHKSRRADIEKVQQLAFAQGATVFVIGTSYLENGSPNAMGRHSISFGKDLMKTTGLSVVYWDEALSTKDAKNLRLETGTSIKNRRGHQDALAAALVLQSYFDNISLKDFSCNEQS